MEQDKSMFVHDTINLDEIRDLLGDAAEIADGPVEDMTPEENESVIAEEPAEETAEEPVETLKEELPTEETAEETEEVLPPAEEEIVDEDEFGPLFPEKKKGSFLQEVYNLLHDVVYLLAAVTLIFVFLVRLVGVQGDSMLPTLHNKDYLVLESNFLYDRNDLRYGDIVVLNVPYYEQSGEGPIVKRIIATEGQTVDIDFQTGSVYVDGVLLAENYINAPTYHNWDGSLAMEYPALVPEGHVFVLGDNRNNSMDSRYAPIGMVHSQYVLGKVLFIALPGRTTDEAGNVIDGRDWSRMGLVS